MMPLFSAFKTVLDADVVEGPQAYPVFGSTP